MRNPRVLTIQDYSEIGRCSLTVALPIISAMGVQCVGMPTALFSNHTAYPSWRAKDLTEEIAPTVAKWKELGEDHFDVIYVGYLTTKQIPVVEEAIKSIRKKGTIVFIDPAFGDNGKLYPGFGEEHVEAMKGLLKMADFAKPNVTEAMLLTGTCKEPKDEKDAINLAKQVKSLGPKDLILTGLTYNDGAQLVYDSASDQFFQGETVPGWFHGTGDVFSSVIAGGFALGLSSAKTIPIDQAFITESLKYNLSNGVPAVEGPCFEKAIPHLISNLNKLLDSERQFK